MRVEQQRWLEAEVERLGPLEAIVRDLASGDPWVEGDIFQGVGCRYCDEPKPGPHATDCDWQRAKAWVEANPEKGT